MYLFYFSFIVVNLPVFAYGAGIGWMSPMALLFQSKDSPRAPLTDFEVSTNILSILGVRETECKGNILQLRMEIRTSIQRGVVSGELCALEELAKNFNTDLKFFLNVISITLRPMFTDI